MTAKQFIHRGCLLLALIGGAADLQGADDFDNFLKPFFARRCIKCHGEKKKVKGKVNLKEIQTAKHFLARPELIKEMIEVIDAADMPPEDEPALGEKDRGKLLAALKTMLRQATATSGTKKVQIRRLNRFQYNNSVRDLFRLNRNIFRLPEKLMTRQGNYLKPGSGKMPDKVDVACLSLENQGGLREVSPFPKDLRAAHGYDNQANQLTLSPLLLDSFLRLSISIVESPDFNPGTVGIWSDFFKEPAAETGIQPEIKKRLGPFLAQAFRAPADQATLKRYTAYAMSKIKQGLSFTDSMKKVSSAALSSPMFLYRYGPASGKQNQFALASNLSFFLWGSGPDLELLSLAESGGLSKPENMKKTLERMFADPKI